MSKPGADFVQRFGEWLNSCQELVNDYYAKNYPNLKPSRLDAEYLTKFVRVWSVVIHEDAEGNLSDGQRLAWAFVSFQEFSTKELGQVKIGDIFKTSSYKKPARHARGSLWDAKAGLGSMSVHGPAYLK